MDQSPRLWQSLSILIWEGDPVDAAIYRHAGLLVTDLDGLGNVRHFNFHHVVGARQMFEYQESVNRNPILSHKNMAARISVAVIPATDPSDRRLRNAIATTPVQNDNCEWNCQNFVHDALARCVSEGLISQAEMAAGFDAMMDVVTEATYMS